MLPLLHVDVLLVLFLLYVHSERQDRCYKLMINFYYMPVQLVLFNYIWNLVKLIMVFGDDDQKLFTYSHLKQ